MSLSVYFPKEDLALSIAVAIAACKGTVSMTPMVSARAAFPLSKECPGKCRIRTIRDSLNPHKYFCTFPKKGV